MEVHFYGVAWITGLLVGAASGLRVVAGRRTVDWRTYGAFACGFVGMILGAKWQYRLEFLPWPAAIAMPPGSLLAGGERTPLAVAMGAAFAALWCAWWRLPWRHLGDGLAFGAMVGLSLGRVGCIVNGCCLGRVCPTSLASLCIMPPPGSQAFMAQMGASGLAHPMPVVPLSILFSLVGWCIVAVLWTQLRRGAPPGRLLAIACLAAPLAKAGLELLRDEPRPPGLMIGLPLAAAACTILVLVGQRRAPGIIARRRMSAQPGAQDRGRTAAG